MTENAEILLRLLLDEAANAKTQQGIKSTYDLLDEEEDSAYERNRRIDKSISETDRRVQESKEKRKASIKALIDYEKKEQEAIEKSNQAYLKRAQILKRFSTQLEQVGRMGLVAGTVLAGGILAEANRYATNAEKATAATIAWNRELGKLSASRNRVDEVLVTQALPLLTKATEMADKASRFIASNPQLVTAALNTGVALATLGSLALVLAKPIKLIADAQLMAAQLAQVTALEKNTAALLGKAGLGSVGAGAGGLLGGGIAATVASVLTAAVVVSAGVALGAVIYDKFIAKKIGGASVAETTTVAAYGLGDLFGKALVATGLITEEEAQKNTERFAASVGRATGAIDKMTTAVDKYNPAGTSGGRRYVSPYVEKTGAEIGSPEYAGISPFMVQTVLDIRNVNAEISKLDATFLSTIMDSMKKFKEADAQAEAQYAAQRSQIVRDGGIEIIRMEQDHQKRLEELRRDRDRKQDDATRARDALAFVKAQREYDDAANEEEDSTNTEIKRRREDIALRLKDLAASNAAERKIRLQQYQNQLKQTQAEYDLKRQALIAEQQNLLYALSHEKEVKAAYNAAIIADAYAFASAYRAALSGAYVVPSSGIPHTGAPFMAGGGYADYGLHVLGDKPGGGRGPREFVMSGRTTVAAEKAIGGALSQEALVNALSSGGQRVILNDHRRIDSNVDAATRRAISRDTINTLTQFVKRK